jgi:hypothetical protein
MKDEKKKKRKAASSPPPTFPLLTFVTLEPKDGESGGKFLLALSLN